MSEPTSENESKLLSEVNGNPLGIERADTIPLLRLDLVDALNAFYPDFLEHFISTILLKHKTNTAVQRLLTTVSLFYKATFDPYALTMLFYAGYLQGQQDERKQLDDLFGKELAKE